MYRKPWNLLAALAVFASLGACTPDFELSDVACTRDAVTSAPADHEVNKMAGNSQNCEACHVNGADGFKAAAAPECTRDLVAPAARAEPKDGPILTPSCENCHMTEGLGATGTP